MEKICIISLVVSVTLFSAVNCEGSSYSEETTPDGQSKIKIKPPILSEEETDSNFIPAHMKCDGCKAVGFQLYFSLTKLEMKFKSKKKVPESEILDTFEKTCHGDTFAQYVLKDIDGTNRLSGPGIEKEAKGPSMMQGGGHWPGRMANICNDFIDEHGEDEIYNNFKGKELAEFQTYLCSGAKFCNGIVKDEL